MYASARRIALHEKNLCLGGGAEKGILSRSVSAAELDRSQLRFCPTPPPLLLTSPLLLLLHCQITIKATVMTKNSQVFQEELNKEPTL